MGDNAPETSEPFDLKKVKYLVRLMKNYDVTDLDISDGAARIHLQRRGPEPSAAAEVTRAVRAVTKKPIILKLSPTAADIAAVAKAWEDAGADGVSLINTLPGMRIDLKRRRPLLANTTGGMSGPGMFPLAVRMVYQVYEAVSIPIVGMGGVTTAEDVIELMLAGATAIGVGAANLVEPYACKTIIENLPAVMERYGMKGSLI